MEVVRCVNIGGLLKAHNITCALLRETDIMRRLGYGVCCGYCAQ
jgi:hypothetical protein